MSEALEDFNHLFCTKFDELRDILKKLENLFTELKTIQQQRDDVPIFNEDINPPSTLTSTSVLPSTSMRKPFFSKIKFSKNNPLLRLQENFRFWIWRVLVPSEKHFMQAVSGKIQSNLQPSTYTFHHSAIAKTCSNRSNECCFTRWAVSITKRTWKAHNLPEIEFPLFFLVMACLYKVYNPVSTSNDSAYFKFSQFFTNKFKN